MQPRMTCRRLLLLLLIDGPKVLCVCSRDNRQVVHGYMSISCLHVRSMMIMIMKREEAQIE
ncbi:unnamed protein product [Prunus brigantina]